MGRLIPAGTGFLKYRDIITKNSLCIIKNNLHVNILKKLFKK
jgi:hypothetical protein